MEYLYDIITFGKYLVAILAILGIVLVIVGLVKSQRMLVTRGAYLFILSIVVAICGYFIYTTMLDRAKDRMQYMESSLTGDY